MYSDQFHLEEKNPEINSVSKYNMFGIGIVMMAETLHSAKVYKILFRDIHFTINLISLESF